MLETKRRVTGQMMGIVQAIVDGFIMTMGITPPTPKMKRTATIFIATGLFGMVAGILAFFTFVVTQLL